MNAGSQHQSRAVVSVQSHNSHLIVPHFPLTPSSATNFCFLGNLGRPQETLVLQEDQLVKETPREELPLHYAVNTDSSCW